MAFDSPKLPDWRRPADYDELLKMDRLGFAWELLRRNQQYRKEASGLDCSGCGGLLTITTAAAQIGEGWGLGFPRGSDSICE